MVYPLLGRGLQNEVVHVPATQSGALGTYQPGVPREALATPQQWIERLRERGVQVLFVALPAPPELAWAEAHPEVFTPRASGGGFRVFDIR
jgi:UDP-N-acetyl-D-mannosaminuronic acid transferase (WecB/TagA/CpsF family)